MGCWRGLEQRGPNIQGRGRPISRIYLSSPDVGDREEALLVEAIRSGWVAPLGPQVDAFEREMAERVGVDHAVALSSGTAALHLALVSWGVGPGDFVPVSSLTFAATVNAVKYTGATPVLVDSDARTGNVSPALLAEALQALGADGRPVPAVIPVDLLGKCADYAAIGDVAAKHGVRILSDAAESLGASDGTVAAGAFGDAAVLSFNGNKVMTTSGGGMLLTGDESLADHVRFLATQAREPVAHYEHREVGYNYRLSNLLAAVGRAQLERLDAMIARRRALRDVYAALFAEVPGVTILGRSGDERDNCWLTSILIDSTVTGWEPADLSVALAEQDIESRPLWKPMHLQPVFADLPSFVDGTAERLFRSGLTLPSGSVLDDVAIKRITGAIEAFLENRG